MGNDREGHRTGLHGLLGANDQRRNSPSDRRNDARTRQVVVRLRQRRFCLMDNRGLNIHFLQRYFVQVTALLQVRPGHRKRFYCGVSVHSRSGAVSEKLQHALAIFGDVGIDRLFGDNLCGG
jgi:hypothetical protein